MWAKILGRGFGQSVPGFWAEPLGRGGLDFGDRCGGAMWGTFGGHDLEELLGQLLGHTKFMATLSAHMDVCP